MERGTEKTNGSGVEMRVLITNYMVSDFTGSEINAYQLCKALHEMGHFAEIGSFAIDEPLRVVLDKQGIRAFDLRLQEESAFNYDLIWAHHSPTLEYLLFNKLKGEAKVIFSSLSSFMAVEAAPSFHSDLSLILANSEENYELMLSDGVNPDVLQLFPNFAPSEFFDISTEEKPQNLKKIAIISNHVPEELHVFSKLAQRQGLLVDLIGFEGEVKFVDPTLIKEYDLVISIGKTVVYALAAKVPVFVYDHFAGPGYLNKENFALSEHHNFSGRGFIDKKTGEQLFSEITENYAANLFELDWLNAQCFTRHNLNRNIEAVLKRLDDRPVLSIEKFKKNHQLESRRSLVSQWVNQFSLNQANKNHQRIVSEIERVNARNLTEVINDCSRKLDEEIRVRTSLAADLEQAQAILVEVRDQNERLEFEFQALREQSNNQLETLREQSNYQLETLKAENKNFEAKSQSLEEGKNTLLQENLFLNEMVTLLNGEIAAYVNSTSWRITRPLRKFVSLFRSK